LQDFVVEIGNFNHHFEQSNTTQGIEQVSEVSDSSFNVLEPKLLLIYSILQELNTRFGAEQRDIYLAAASLAASEFTLETW